MLRFKLFFLLVILSPSLSAQISDSSSVGTSLDLPAIFEKIEERFNVRIYYEEEYIPNRQIVLNWENKTVVELLQEALNLTGLSYLNYKNYAFIVHSAERLNRNYNQEYFENQEKSNNTQSSLTNAIEEITIGSPDKFNANEKIIIKGFVTDDAIGDPIIGATFLIKELDDGVISNEIGQYVMDLGLGEYSLIINSLGFMSKEVKLKVFSSGEYDFKLSKDAIQLDEVVVTSEGNREGITRREIGLEALSAAEIKKLPAFLGEVDVVKSLLLLPGVSTVGEGSGGFNVRGGTVDQNLIMQDGLYLFNSSHVLGLFSLFNPDLVSSVNLFKGNMPAKFGGRLSSVLDVELKEGNYQKFTGKGGLGFASSRLTLESPVKKGSSSIILGVRTSYSDWIFDIVNFADLRESSAFFYDSNLKFTQRIKNKGKWVVNAYLSRDRFQYSDEFDFDWRTTGVNTGFNYLLSEKLSLSLEAVYSKYSSIWKEPQENIAFNLKSGIEYFKFRSEIVFNPVIQHAINFGIEGNLYTADPGFLQPSHPNSTTISTLIEEEHARDLSIYIEDNYQISDDISISIGVRLAIFQSLGPALVNLYEEGTPRSLSTQSSQVEYNSGDVIASYRDFEPRLSLNFGLSETSSIKLSYNRTQQFINQISNTTAVAPVDVWQLSNSYIEPQRAHNYSAGYYKSLDDVWESSIEFFYRDIDNLIEYKDLADLLVSDHIETELLSGIGRTYGIEFSLKKNIGRWNGWLGYTYSKAERRTSSDFPEESINGNQWFFSNYDKPHDVSLALSYQVNKRNYFSVNFVYSSGRPTTAPVGKFSIDNIFNIPYYSNRNAFRIPNYHRLDISYTIEQSHRKTQKWRSSWTFSVYNVYGRKNAFTVFFTQAPFQNPKTNRLAILGSAFPSITYNFSF